MKLITLFTRRADKGSFIGQSRKTLDTKPTILFVEHDEAFINRVATKVITLKRA
jgi:ABC-type uncharacterized transport system ATPase subunit